MENTFQESLQWLFPPLGQHGATILIALAPANSDFARTKVDVFNMYSRLDALAFQMISMEAKAAPHEKLGLPSDFK